MCVKHALKSGRSLSAEVGHYMEEVLKLDTLHERSAEAGHYMKEVLKFDITWEKKKSSE